MTRVLSTPKQALPSNQGLPSNPSDAVLTSLLFGGGWGICPRFSALIRTTPRLRAKRKTNRERQGHITKTSFFKFEYWMENYCVQKCCNRTFSGTVSCLHPTRMHVSRLVQHFKSYWVKRSSIYSKGTLQRKYKARRTEQQHKQHLTQTLYLLI